MKTIVILGSRNPDGQTARAAAAVASGAASAGAEVEVETVVLTELQIERCRQCDPDGWGKCRREAACVIEDDFAGLVERVRNADAVVFATPVYFASLSESLRAFLDRLRRVCRFTDGNPGIEGKHAVGVCVAGGMGGGAPACSADLVQVLLTCGFSVVDMIPVRRQNLAMKLGSLTETGRWLAAGAPEG